jgi:hypothetical protein
MHFPCFFGNAPTTSRQGTLRFYTNQSQSINKVATRFDVYIKGNRNDFFATRGADIASKLIERKLLCIFPVFLETHPPQAVRGRCGFIQIKIAETYVKI